MQTVASILARLPLSRQTAKDKMTSTAFSTRPSKSLNWADDEDDFDLDTWKASADTSAPTVEDLGPLQRTPNEDESPLVLSVSKLTNNPTARVSTETLSSTNTKPQTEPSDPAPPTEADYAIELEYVQAQKLFEQNALDYECEQGRICLLDFALRKKPDPPAYWELSFYSDGPYSPDRRVEYTRNWNDAKSCGGQSYGRGFQYKSSPLSRMRLAEDQEPDLAPDLEGQDKAAEDVGEVALDIDTGWELEESFEEEREALAIPRPSSPVPWLRRKDRSVFDVAKTRSVFEDSDSDSEEDEDREDGLMEQTKTSPLETSGKDHTASHEPIITNSDDSVSDADFDFDEVFENTYDRPICDKNSHSLTGSDKSLGPKSCLSFGCYMQPLHHNPVNEDTPFELSPEKTAQIEEAVNNYKASLKASDESNGSQMNGSAQTAAEDIFWAPISSADDAKSDEIQTSPLYNDLQIPLQDRNSCFSTYLPSPTSSNFAIQTTVDIQSKASPSSTPSPFDTPRLATKSVPAGSISSRKLSERRPLARSPWTTASAFATALIAAGLIYSISSLASLNVRLGFHFLLFFLLWVL